ncbi:hypothetical protein LF65_05650 [Clostridium beijerinckii]|uniref:Uncharacterized protein n=1 Tax=Clostridium beijerinckii TaxID=1520 RepID=A0A0B5QVC5_CLOBE|nr:hypothetical protein [Clostridium beijerinckii]AJH02157.1 hypothetical protein LF65_05650 [Clostridium beijerinckii]
MNIDDINKTMELIEKSKPIRSDTTGLSGIYIDDSIILDDISLTKSCILFDNVIVNYINPSLYINTIYKEFDFDRIKNIEQNGIKLNFEKGFYGQVESYNFINFINLNGDLVKESVLTPNVFHSIPKLSQKSDKEILLELLNDNNEQILNLVEHLELKREKNIFCIDEPFLYILKLININSSFLEAIMNKKIVISEKRNIINYAVECSKDTKKVKAFNSEDFKIQDYVIKDTDINSSIDSLILDTFNILIPNFPSLKPDEILEVRYKLKNELGAYRALIKDLSQQYSNNRELNNSEIIQREFTNKINDITLKLKSEKSKLFRNIITYATAFPTASGILSGGNVKSIVASC